MSTTSRAVARTPEPVRAPTDELVDPARPLVRRVARVRIPLTLTCQPWATAYRLPNGAVVWCLRLRQDGRVVRAVVSTAALRSYAVRSRLPELLAAIDRASSAPGAR